jgi:hypothetical protein
METYFWEKAIEQLDDHEVIWDLFHNLRPDEIPKDVVGSSKIDTNLSESAALTALVEVKLKFGNKANAIYHLIQHGLRNRDNFPDFLQDANQFMRRNDIKKWSTNDALHGRYFYFSGNDQNIDGFAVVYENDGSVTLCTYKPPVIAQ